jgi:phosphoserine aminotransferase
MDNWDIDKNAKYFYFCQNESIDGVELDQKLMRKLFDRVKADRSNTVFVADLSSSIGSRDLS